MFVFETIFMGVLKRNRVLPAMVHVFIALCRTLDAVQMQCDFFLPLLKIARCES